MCSSEDQKRVENILRRVYQQDTEELDSDDDGIYTAYVATISNVVRVNQPPRT